MPRLIDADALKNDILKSAVMIDDRGIQTGYEIAIELIKRQPTIDIEPQWIPCSERLPEKSDKYYVSGGDKVWICEFLIIPNFTGGWCNDASNPVVQAWMPLPKPYEVNNE